MVLPKLKLDLRRLDVFNPCMPETDPRRRPGEVRDAVLATLRSYPSGAAVHDIISDVRRMLGDVTDSSVRSYLRLNTPRLFERPRRGHYRLSGIAGPELPATAPETFRTVVLGQATLVLADCVEWLASRDPESVHAVVTDPPYGLVEYSSKEQTKLRNRRGGVWRLPPTFDGVRRSPLPRFTVMSPDDVEELGLFFVRWATALIPVLVPGANVVVAANPLLSHVVATALARSGLERRGEVVRLVTTMRGGDRPKGAHQEFGDVSVMPRSMWEPWLVFRKPIEGTVRDNLRKWRTGGFRRPSDERPFGDVIRSAPTRKEERALAPHPSLKPQRFLRRVVRAVLPLGEGTVLDPFCGSGSTLAAASAVDYESIGIEMDPHYYEMAVDAVPRLARYQREQAMLF